LYKLQEFKDIYKNKKATKENSELPNNKSVALLPSKVPQT